MKRFLDKSSAKYLFSIIFLLIFLVFWAKGNVVLDPDFGWHLMTGRLILNTGIPKLDPFSYTMPSFPFVNHEWLTDVMFAFIDSITGLVGLAILFSLLFVVIVLISIRVSNKLKYFYIALFIIGITSLEPFYAVSPRVISWMFFSLLIYFVSNKKLWEKYWILIPVLVFIWANLHGSFILGIGIFGIIFTVRSFVRKKVQIKEFLILFFSILASFINPYGQKLWWLVWLTVSDPSQKLRITEWTPTFFVLPQLSFLMYFLMALSFILIFKYKNKFEAEEIILNICFFIFAFIAVRNVPLWILIDLPMVGTALAYFYRDICRKNDGKSRFIKVSQVFLIFCLAIFSLQTISPLFIGSSEITHYPSKAVSYLLNNLPTGQIFAEYNWGGYLVWKLPQKKVFISGLMPVWKTENSPPGESKSAIDDYSGIINGKIDYQPVFSKFGINTVLLSSPRVAKGSLSFLRIEPPFLNALDLEDTSKYLRDKLAADGWKIVYQDETSVIYQY